MSDAGAAPVPPPGGAGASSCPDLLDRLSRRLRQEVDAADLPLASGDSVVVVDLDEVEHWLVGCAIRLRNGEAL